MAQVQKPGPRLRARVGRLDLQCAVVAEARHRDRRDIVGDIDGALAGAPLPALGLRRR